MRCVDPDPSARPDAAGLHEELIALQATHPDDGALRTARLALLSGQEVTFATGPTVMVAKSRAPTMIEDQATTLTPAPEEEP